MATPVSFKGVVEQYAGRLNRDYEGKGTVIIYDYVDSRIPMFDNMYSKRLKAYRQIGYDICSGIQGEKQSADSIFGSDTYYAVYSTDLQEARSSLVLGCVKYFCANSFCHSAAGSYPTCWFDCSSSFSRR